MDVLNLLHPKLVHLPIALVVTAWGFDLVSIMFKKEPVFKAAVYVYATAALTAVLAVLSGLWEAQRLHLHHPVLTAHQNFAYVFLCHSWMSLIIYFLLRRFYPRFSRGWFSAACAISVALVLVIGFYGGKMVYEYGIGVAAN